MAILGESNYALIQGQGTSINGIIPDVVVQEVYRDSLIITDHPVERGAAITDHAFKRPTTLEMTCGFSNSSAGSEGYIDEVYEDLQQLQSVRRPFNVFTPRRMYKNMLVSELGVTRDAHTNSVLMCSLVLREVILTSTTSASVDSGSQADPARTGAEAERGSLQPAPLAQSESLSPAEPTGVTSGGTDVAVLAPTEGGETLSPVPPGTPTLPSETVPGDYNVTPSTSLPDIVSPADQYTPIPQFDGQAGNPMFIP